MAQTDPRTILEETGTALCNSVRTKLKVLKSYTNILLRDQRHPQDNTDKEKTLVTGMLGYLEATRIACHNATVVHGPEHIPTRTWIRSWDLMTRTTPVQSQVGSFEAYSRVCKFVRVEYPKYILDAESYLHWKFSGEKKQREEVVNTLGTGELPSDFIFFRVTPMHGWSDKCVLLTMTYLLFKQFGLIVLHKDDSTSSQIDMSKFETLVDENPNVYYRIVTGSDTEDPLKDKVNSLQLVSIPEHSFIRYLIFFDFATSRRFVYDLLSSDQPVECEGANVLHAIHLPNSSSELNNVLQLWSSNKAGTPTLFLIPMDRNNPVEIRSLVPSATDLDRGPTLMAWDPTRKGWWMFVVYKIPEKLSRWGWGISRTFVKLTPDLQLESLPKLVFECEGLGKSSQSASALLTYKSSSRPNYMVVSSDTLGDEATVVKLV